MDNETIFCDLTSREREILQAIAEGLIEGRERPQVVDEDLRIYSITTAATNADPMMFVYGYACGKRRERQRKKGRENNGL